MEDELAADAVDAPLFPVCGPLPEAGFEDVFELAAAPLFAVCDPLPLAVADLVPAAVLLAGAGAGVGAALDLVDAAGALAVDDAAFVPDGVGVEDGLGLTVCWPAGLALPAAVFCAMAIAVIDVASARIRISFISNSFPWTLNTPIYFAAGAAGWPGRGGPGAAATGSGSWLKNVVAVQLATMVSPGAY